MMTVCRRRTIVCIALMIIARVATADTPDPHERIGADEAVLLKAVREAAAVGRWSGFVGATAKGQRRGSRRTVTITEERLRPSTTMRVPSGLAEIIDVAIADTWVAGLHAASTDSTGAYADFLDSPFGRRYLAAMRDAFSRITFEQSRQIAYEAQSAVITAETGHGAGAGE